MANRFKCTDCGAIIITKFLRPGEQASCRTCSALNTVPENAETVSDSDHDSWVEVTTPSRSGAGTPPPPSSGLDYYENPPPEAESLIANPETRFASQYFSLGMESLSGNWGLAIYSIIIYIASIFFLGLVAMVVPFFDTAVNALISPALAAGVISLFLKLVARRNPVIEDVMNGFYQYGTVLGLQFIYIFCILIVTIPMGFMVGFASLAAPENIPPLLIFSSIGLMVVGFTLVSVFFIFIYPLVMDERRVGAIDAIIYSAKMVLPHYWKVLGFYFLGIILLVLSFLLFLLPALFMIPIFSASLIRLYLDLRADYERINGPIPLHADTHGGK